MSELSDEQRATLADAVIHANEAACWSCEDAPFATVARMLADARAEGASEVRARVEALCNAAERYADTYKRACIVTTGQVRDALTADRAVT